MIEDVVAARHRREGAAAERDGFPRSHFLPLVRFERFYECWYANEPRRKSLFEAGASRGFLTVNAYFRRRQNIAGLHKAGCSRKFRPRFMTPDGEPSEGPHRQSVDDLASPVCRPDRDADATARQPLGLVVPRKRRDGRPRLECPVDRRFGRANLDG